MVEKPPLHNIICKQKWRPLEAMEAYGGNSTNPLLVIKDTDGIRILILIHNAQEEVFVLFLRMEGEKFS